MNIVEFFDSDIKEYSIYACKRAIPSGVDGLKPSQRKVLFGMRKEYPSVDSEIKVSIASASIMGISAYHHGSLDSVVVGMAQNFPGSNNIPLLDGIGQFGNRISPVAAASRYIFTRLSKHAQKLFNQDDDNILEWLNEEGQSIEPKFYIPLLPIILINGASGMGTGYATNILQYNPDKIRVAMIEYLSGKVHKPLVPWFNGYTGKVEKVESQWVISGVLEVVNTTTIRISELPVGVNSIKYRETLNTLEDKGIIKSYDDNSSDTSIEFIVNVPRETTKLSHDKLMTTFKLISRETETIVVWDEFEQIRTFQTVDQLLHWFTEYRLKRISDRIEWIISTTTEALNWTNEQINFIDYFKKHGKRLIDLKQSEIKIELADAGFSAIDKLLSIRISNLNSEFKDRLKSTYDQLQAQLEYYTSVDHRDYMIKELKELKIA